MMNVTFRLSLAVVVLMSAAGCASMRTARGPAGDLERDANRSLQAFLDCAYTHGDAMARDSRNPPDIADAALAYCERRHAHYCTTAGAYFASVASPENKNEAQARAQERCVHAREETRGVLIARVQRERELFDQRLEQAREEYLNVPAGSR